MTFEQLRQSQRWTRKLLAGALGIDQSTVAKWETAGRFPNANTLSKLERLLDVSKAVIVAALDEQHRAQP